MFGVSYLDISAGMGLCATGLLTFNFLLGMMLSTGYKRSVYWKKLPEQVKKLSIDDLHNWTAYVALLFVLLHPLFLLMDTGNKFTIIDIVLPLNAPKQPTIVLLGSLSLLALLIVIITTQKNNQKESEFPFMEEYPSHLLWYRFTLSFSWVINGPRAKRQTYRLAGCRKILL